MNIENHLSSVIATNVMIQARATCNVVLFSVCSVNIVIHLTSYLYGVAIYVECAVYIEYI